MEEPKTPLEELKTYLGVQMTLIEARDPSIARDVEGILERIISAQAAGATPQEISDALYIHISALQPDRTYG
jgi:hypothetical protein